MRISLTANDRVTRVHPDRREDQDRLVGHDLEQFPFRPDVAVRGVGRVGPENQEDLSERERKDDEKEVAAGKEKRSREDRKDKVADHVVALGLVDIRCIFLEEFSHIVERLEDRGADPALHVGGDLPVDPREETADDRGEQDKQKTVHERNHRNTPDASAVTNMTTMNTPQTQIPVERSRASPNQPPR